MGRFLFWNWGSPVAGRSPKVPAGKPASRLSRRRVWKNIFWPSIGVLQVILTGQGLQNIAPWSGKLAFALTWGYPFAKLAGSGFGGDSAIAKLYALAVTSATLVMNYDAAAPYLEKAQAVTEAAVETAAAGVGAVKTIVNYAPWVRMATAPLTAGLPLIPTY